jgi:hypothetical protein
MKIIFSRKGFDSSSGGAPSPIFPDGRILSLPIPDKQSPICYNDIRWDEYSLGTIVSQLTNGKIRGSYRAHLDPDLRREGMPRFGNWKPVLGQTGAAQSHLRNYSINTGDVFLFFGLFQEVHLKGEMIVWNKQSMPRHILWGWLQVGEVIQVDRCNKTEYGWAGYHPHFHRTSEKNNTLYIAQQYLSLPGNAIAIQSGAGVFQRYTRALQLTAPSATRTTEWELPTWIFPKNGRLPLSYHKNMTRWQTLGQTSRLKVVSRGQEFVLDCSYYPEAIEWLYQVIYDRTDFS